MTKREYEDYVQLRSKDDLDLNYAIIALNEEAGECAGWHKKFNLRGNPTGKLSREDLLSELGDVLFYLTRAAALNGWTLDDVMEKNKEKLDERKGRHLRQVV